jgi:hypothetical protein
MGCSPGHSWATRGSDWRPTAVSQSEPDWRLADGPTARGILPSWSCEFDSRHPLHVKALVNAASTMPSCFCVTVRRARAITWANGCGATNSPLEPQLSVYVEMRLVKTDPFDCATVGV